MRGNVGLAAVFCMVAAILPGPALGADTAPPSDTAPLSGNVARWVAGAERLGAADKQRTVGIVVHLALRDTAGLRALVEAVSKPGAPDYGKYLTFEQFKARFGPDAASVEAVRTMLRDAGMVVTRTGAMGSYVQATATVGEIERAFHVSQDDYRLGTMVLRANREAPTVPAALATKIAFIAGLDDTALLRRPQFRHAADGVLRAPAGWVAETAMPSTPLPRTPLPVAAYSKPPYCNTAYGDLQVTLSTPAAPYGSRFPWLVCGYTPQQVRSGYGMDGVPQTGAGLRIAITDAYASPTILADLNRYAANHALPPLTAANFRQIIPPGIFRVDPNNPCGPYGWWHEESLDVTAVHAAAPGASIVYVGGSDCTTGLDVAAVDAVDGQVADIISNSWADDGEFPAYGSITVIDQILMQAAAFGISVVFSTGDYGDLAQLNGVASGSLPADSAYDTAVGGTSLAIRSAPHENAEWGWGNASTLLGSPVVHSETSITTSGPVLYTYLFGAGGGPSLLESQPTYQQRIVPSTFATQTYSSAGEIIPLSPARRVTPDVSMVADPYTGFLVGESFTISPDPANNAGCTPTGATTEYCETTTGGTSLATPLFAGVLALVDEARLARHAPLLGFANPWLYGLAVNHVGRQGGPLNDVRAPGLGRGVLAWSGPATNRVRFATIGSEPGSACPGGICRGLNDVFNVTGPGYDVVTGLGAPWVPLLVGQ